jgi:hypothetical protein
MKTAIAAAAAACLALAAGTARAADYVSIVQETSVKAPAEVTWKSVRGYCAIGAWLKTTCEITSGTDGELGAVRKIAGRIEEVIVARTPMSYTYADPNQPILYHGTVEVRPIDGRTSRIVYTLFYDQTTIKEDARSANREARAKTFAKVLETMKSIAEAP